MAGMQPTVGGLIASAFAIVIGIGLMDAEAAGYGVVLVVAGAVGCFMSVAGMMPEKDDDGNPVNDESRLKSRLAQVDELHESGAINARERNARRKEILAEI